MAEMHRELVARLGARPSAVILDTPYGFQENADAVSDRTIRYFARSVGLDVEVASGMRAPAESRIRVPRPRIAVAGDGP